jgi:thioredoxin:protein disulfide reductase
MKKLTISLVLLLISSPVFSLDPEALLNVQQELLEPDKAFVLSTRVVDATTLEASWKIADGYYLYRDKFKFELIKGDVEVQAPLLPAGKVKKDPTFGDVETYVHDIAIRVPLTRNKAGAQTIKVRITSQGCNEPVGVCYPPVVKSVDFDLPASKVTSPGIKKEIGSLKDLSRIIDQGSDPQREFLHPDEAFKVNVTPDNGSQISVHFSVAEGYYLYRNKINFSLLDKEGAVPEQKIKLGKFTLPKGKMKDDPYFGRLETYPESFSVKLALENVSPGDTFVLKVDYQGCAENGICYPPTFKNLKLTMPDVNGNPAIIETEETGPNFILAVLAAFVVGLALTFTPCVLPMIPILSSVIVEESTETITKLRGGMLATSYVLGTAVTYTVAGAIAGATGDQLQAYFQNVWAIGILSTIFVLLALSMFGFFSLQMPTFIRDHLHSRTQRMKGGSYVGVFVLGLVSALVVGACVSPLLISALSVAIASKDPVLGGAIMFSMSWGMGAILIALGVGAGFLLPKAGMWMDRVKHFFGVLLLAVAIYFLGILPEVPVLLLWAALLIVTSMYFGAIQPVPEGASGWRYFWKGIGVVMLIWGVLALVGGVSGNRDILQPVSFSGAGMTSFGGQQAMPSADQPDKHDLGLFKQVSTVSELDQQLTAARAAGKPVILDFFAEWCTDCIRMEKVTFAHPVVRKIMKDNFILLQVDVTDSYSQGPRAIKKRYDVFGPPAMLFFDDKGKQRTELNFYGYKSPEEFMPVLEKAHN